MTTETIADAGDPRRLLSDVRALAHRVRLDQRVTWAALLVPAALNDELGPLKPLITRVETTEPLEDR